MPTWLNDYGTIPLPYTSNSKLESCPYADASRDGASGWELKDVGLGSDRIKLHGQGA